jgi:hypothetical protein
MSIEIDSDLAHCTLNIDGAPRRVRLDSLRVFTDPERRASGLESDGQRLPITEPEAEQLIAAGATDDRENLVADD